MMGCWCALCNRHFGSEGALEQHQHDSPLHAKPPKVRHDSPIQTETFRCETCQSHFGSGQALAQHQRDAPQHPKPFSCEVCKRSYGSEQALKQHERDSPTHLASFSCGDCKRTFGSEEAIKQHRRDAHKKAKASKGVSKAGSQSPLPEANAVLPSTTSHVVDRPLDHDATRAQPKKAKKAPRIPEEEETRTFFQYPSLHKRIRKAVLPEIRSTWFHADSPSKKSDDGVHQIYSTFVMGSFSCKNKMCKKHGWSSGKVSIVIQGYAGNGYSATVYSQRCKRCNHLGTFALDEESYVERVAYRLKKWAGVPVAQPFFDGIGGPPHETDFCEGCKRGACGESGVRGKSIDRHGGFAR